MKTLPQIIRAEIAARGILPFSRFMELALYCPDYGYYEQQKDTVGPRGDFITSVSSGELFGQLLAFQFAAWLEELRVADGALRIVEAGAHDGRLARDILTWLDSNRPGLFSRLEYLIIEPSPRRQQWQDETLAGFKGKARWAAQWSELKKPRATVRTPQPIFGVIFSNELLDAFPIRRFGWDAKIQKWFEWGVVANTHKFVWAKIPVLHSGLPAAIRQLPASLLEVLPDGYTFEESPAAENWWREAAGKLADGKLVAIDYGFTADEWISPARMNGTLRAYFRHHPAVEPLENPGEQDLTAHVNFSAIQKAGEEAGLKTDCLQTQPQFLTKILEKAVSDKSFADWNPSRTRQVQTLTHPEHLGRAFRILVQSRESS